MEGLTFGCDPELFVFDTRKEKFVCADGLIPGTKEEPYPVKNGAVQVDGMAAEFNIDPVSTFEDFRRNVKSVMKQLEKMLPDGHILVTTPHVVFDEDVWKEAPYRAKKLGCSPDFNAWTGAVNPPPKDKAMPTLRTASGHLHIGWTQDASMSDSLYVKSCRDLVRQLDYYLGVWSVSVDKDPVRRRLYGKAGAMRFKPYGTEYRVLSNFWLKNDYRMLAVWNRMQRAIWDMRTNFLPSEEELIGGADMDVVYCIDNSVVSNYLRQAYKFPVVTIDK